MVGCVRPTGCVVKKRPLEVTAYAEYEFTNMRSETMFTRGGPEKTSFLKDVSQQPPAAVPPGWETGTMIELPSWRRDLPPGHLKPLEAAKIRFIKGDDDQVMNVSNCGDLPIGERWSLTP